jgi:hypothetical protein
VGLKAGVEAQEKRICSYACREKNHPVSTALSRFLTIVKFFYKILHKMTIGGILN